MTIANINHRFCRATLLKNMIRYKSGPKMVYNTAKAVKNCVYRYKGGMNTLVAPELRAVTSVLFGTCLVQTEVVMQEMFRTNSLIIRKILLELELVNFGH